MREFSDLHVHMSEFNFDRGEAMLDIMADIGVKRAGLMSLTYRSVIYNLWLLYWKSVYKKMDLSVFGMIHPDGLYSDIPFEEQAKALIDMGCDGIKMMFAPGSRKRTGIGIDDPKYDKMFDYLEKNGIPVVAHVADPEEFWVPRELTDSERERGWGYFNGGYHTKEELYEETFRRLDRNPRLKITLAHFFFLSNFYDEAVRVMEKYPSVSFDLTPGWEMYLGFSKDIPKWRGFFERYSDRIFYGTDSNDTKSFISELNMHVRWALDKDCEFVMPFYPYPRVHGLGLSPEIADKILNGNYIKYIAKPSPVDTDKLIAYAERVISDLAAIGKENAESEIACLRGIITRLSA